ncbi:ABC transporter ATP-binding protein [Enterovibrio nigricans]|uniref:Peptide/nickel transport system ATP-binding protein n=1 Tax=Enterovibrio nigricans DSM 22720 TaxID=1121868 RepID=A0A1T4UXM8_9GAMM|nr:oligopeptide/dipeptide ABC transporter ATP-binding protein [Enterovibrio nigricans]PKF50643.1 dipeptide ABC transporter ATP-binding protein [Enterovibrio nigricans]SKA57395.1 peptide/nickel transport system ATP-binding protein [Enterovibrio nigricans DSM 22720]
MTILTLNQVSQHYVVRDTHGWRHQAQVLKAVDNISLSIHRGETVAIVGESGCGKSTLGRIAALLDLPTKGSVEFDGINTAGLKGTSLRALRRRLGLVFQDPYSALNPRLPVAELVGEPLAAHSIGDSAYRRDKVIDVLNSVGLGQEVLDCYPHEFSGGQRQRICIARALILDPSLIIADEPLSALDVSVQSQILNLFVELQRCHQLAFLFISHDMAVVNYLADTVVVMYLGKVVEQAPRATFFAHPAHPYSQALLAAVPQLGAGRRKRGLALQGDVPSPIDPPSGCSFHPRCIKATEKCKRIEPSISALSDESHKVACHFPVLQGDVSGNEIGEVSL